MYHYKDKVCSFNVKLYIECRASSYMTLGPSSFIDDKTELTVPIA